MDQKLQIDVDNFIKILDNIEDTNILKICYKCCLKLFHPGTDISKMEDIFNKIKSLKCYKNAYMSYFFNKLEEIFKMLDKINKKRFLYYFSKKIKFYLEKRNAFGNEPKNPGLLEYYQEEYIKPRKWNGNIFEYIKPDLRTFMDDKERHRMKINFKIFENDVRDYKIKDYNLHGIQKPVEPFPSNFNKNSQRKRPFETDSINIPQNIPTTSISMIQLKYNEEKMRTMSQKEKKNYLVKYLENYLTTKYEKQIVFCLSKIFNRFRKFGKNVVFIVKGGQATRLYLEYLGKLIKSDLRHLAPTTSDWDTGIYINPNLNSTEWNKILDEVIIIVKEELSQFNEEFSRKFRGEINNIKNEYVNVIPDQGTRLEILETKMCRYRDCDKTKKGCKCFEKPRTVFSESYNYMIGVDQNKPVGFYLTRLKFNVNIKNQIKRQSIECIDISIEKENSKNLKKLWMDRFGVLYKPTLIVTKHGFKIPIPSLEYLNLEEHGMIQELEKVGPSHPGFRKLKKRKERLQKLNEAMCHLEGTVFDGKKMENFDKLEEICLSKNIKLPKCDINPTVNKWIWDTTKKQNISKNKTIDLILKLVSRVTPIYFENENIAKNILFSFRKSQLCNILVWYFRILYNYLTDEQITEYLNARFTQNNNKKFDYLGEVEAHLISLIDHIDNQCKENHLVTENEILNWKHENKDEIINFFIERIIGICIKNKIKENLEGTLRKLYKKMNNAKMFIIGGEAIRQHYPGYFDTPDYDIDVLIDQDIPYFTSYRTNLIKTLMSEIGTLVDSLNKISKINCFTEVSKIRFKHDIFQLKYSNKIILYVIYYYKIKNKQKSGKANLFEIQIFNKKNDGINHALEKFGFKSENMKGLTFEKNGLLYASKKALRSEFEYRKGKRIRIIDGKKTVMRIKDHIDIIRGRLLNRD